MGRGSSLLDVPLMFYHAFMTESRSTAHLIADLIKSSPAWTRVGITAPTSRVREESINNLADHLAAGLARVRDTDRDQLPLPL